MEKIDKKQEKIGKNPDQNDRKRWKRSIKNMKKYEKIPIKMMEKDR